MMVLPKDWKIYSNSIRDRCRDLIEYKIWGGMDLNRFDMWRQNFKSDEEKYFSACLLDSLIYRSNPQTYSLIHQLLYRNLNNLFRLLGRPDMENFPYCLQNPLIDPLVRLVPVNTKNDPVTKSSNEILRFMKRYFQVSESWITNPWNVGDDIKKGVKALIFIDDFVGTGNQFEGVVIDAQLEDVIKKSLIVYAPLVAHADGISALQISYPNLKITYSEKLERAVNSFFPNYFPTEIAEAKSMYLEILNSAGIDVFIGNEYGYGDLELTFAFEHAVPDNSLQLLHKRTSKWKPLFDR